MIGAMGTSGQPFYPAHRLFTRRYDEPARVSIEKIAAALRARGAAAAAG